VGTFFETVYIALCFVDINAAYFLIMWCLH